MSVKFDNASLKAAIDASGKTQLDIAVGSSTAPETVRKAYKGNMSMRISSLVALAKYLHLDVVISIRPKKERKVAA